MKEKKPINIEIGQRVKQYREAAGLTQEVFAEMIGLGVKHVSAIECGAVGVSLATLKQASIVLSIPADFLLFGEETVEERQQRVVELQAITARIGRLPSQKYDIVKDILNRLLEGFALE